jgi:hypothetical protein
MNIFKNGVLVDEYTPSYGGKKIVIAIDSSKSNSAIVVGDAYGNVLDDYEISGAGSETDVYDLCAITRTQLKSLFCGADILMVGIEDIITKKEKGYKGIEIHQSRYKITAVFDNFIFLFEEFFGIRPRRINNWDWKTGILPEEYRKRNHDKGSKDWFNDMGNRWSGRKDDVTDAVCIFMYLFKINKIKTTYTLKETSPTSVKYNIAIMPVRVAIPNGAKEFVIENSDSLEHNIATIANNISQGQLGVLKVKTESIPIEWIYSDKLKYSTKMSYQRVERELLLVVERSS